MTTTAIKARTFETRSPASAELVKAAAALRGCACRPYEDWFTYQRWQAQGMQVQKGEKSTRIPYYITEELDQDDGTTKTVSHRTASCLFCRCQVKPKE